MSYGVSTSGFNIPTKTELKEQLSNNISSNLNLDINDATRLEGQLCSFVIELLSNNWSITRQVFNQNFYETAFDSGLSLLARNYGLERKVATPTKIKALLLLNSTGTINVSTQFKFSISGDLFTLEKQETISLDNINAVRVKPSSTTTGDEIKIDVNKSSISYTIQAGDTLAKIITGLKTAIDGKSLTGVVTVKKSDALIIYNLDAILEVNSLSKIAITGYGRYLTLKSVSFGDIDFKANNLEVSGIISSPLEVLLSNPYVRGSAQETDGGLRIRVKNKLLEANKRVQLENIINDLEGVIYVKVYENKTNTTDNIGVPAHSYRVLVDGGADKEIGQAIWDAGVIGISSVGDISVSVLDSLNNQQTVKFSRISKQYIWVEATISYDSEVSNPISDSNIKKLINNYKTKIGEDIFTAKVAGLLTTQEGISNCTIKLYQDSSSSATPTYEAKDLSISYDQIALFSSDRFILKKT